MAGKVLRESRPRGQDWPRAEFPEPNPARRVVVSGSSHSGSGACLVRAVPDGPISRPHELAAIIPLLDTGPARSARVRRLEAGTP